MLQNVAVRKTPFSTAADVDWSNRYRSALTVSNEGAWVIRCLSIRVFTTFG